MLLLLIPISLLLGYPSNFPVPSPLFVNDNQSGFSVTSINKLFLPVAIISYSY